MAEAAIYAYQAGLKTHSEFLKLSESGQRPAFLPSSLRTYYPEYKSWQEFINLGKSLSEQNTEGPTDTPHLAIDYYELKFLIKSKRIHSIYAYHKARRAGELPLGTPANPDKFYSEFEGWDEFLSDEPNRLTYSEAKALIKPFQLKSSYQWRNFCREGHKPDGVPVLPDRDYPEFVSWPDFLGYEE